MDIETNSDSSTFLDTLGSNLIVLQILIPTRITSRSKTLIDNIFSSINEYETKSGNLCFAISDHLPQFCLFECPYSPNSRKNTVYKQDWSKFDQENFTLDFLAIDWKSVFEECDFNPDFSCDIFISKINSLIDQHLPTRNLTKRQIKTRSKPWITAGILKAISKRDFYHRKFIKAKDPTTKSKFHDSFKSYRNMIVNLCRQS